MPPREGKRKEEAGSGGKVAEEEMGAGGMSESESLPALLW